MDYGSAGNTKPAKNAPKHKEHNSKGSDKNPFGGRASKEELLAKMKAQVEAKKKA